MMRNHSGIAVMLSLLTLVIADSAVAQSIYPEKPVRLLNGFRPGSQADVVARLFAERFTEAWGRPVLVESVAGAAGSIAAERVAKAVPDGYTLGLLGQASLVINPELYKLAYNPVTDLTPVSQVTVAPNILVVHDALPAKNVRELVALAKARPAELTYASSGVGSAPHMAAELFKSAAGLSLLHIPYNGPTSIPDMIGGRVTMAFFTIANAIPVVREGKLRALAVTSLKRSAVFPDLPTIAESGYPGFEATLWYGLLAPARTSATIVTKIHSESVKALASPELRLKLANLGVEGVGSSPDDFAAFIKSEIPKWATVIKASGIKSD